MNDAPPRRDDIVTLTVEKAAYEGKAVARLGAFVVFVEGAVPGDTVRARIFRAKKQFAEAAMVELLSPSPHRAEPACRHFGVCGGCSWQMMSYEEQLRWKGGHVRDAYERIGKFPSPPVGETLPSPERYFYRNKMEYSFGEKRWRLQADTGIDGADEPLFALGLHVPGRYDKILHIDDCRLQSPQSNAILNFTREFFLSHGVPAYSTKTHTGDLRHLVIREGRRSGERMVFLVTTLDRPELLRRYADALNGGEALGVTTFVHGVTGRASMVAVADTETVYFGSGKITEQLGGNVFIVSPSSFFQTNTLQAERLYGVAAGFADLRPADTVWDLYCGAGTISLFVAGRVRSVTGVELNRAAIEDARENARRNRVGNVRFECRDIVDFVSEAFRGGEERPDVIILDPPRAGLHPAIAAAIGSSGCGRIVYVSCNPATSARDCAILAGQGYRIEAIAPVDMFPHTYHIECVVSLRRTDPVV